MKKILILSILAMVLVAIVITGCAKPTAAPTEAPAAMEAPAADQEEFTAAQLAAYNGKDGAKAYIAVDGVVYDVTDVPQWKDGMHNGYEAGKDLTTEIKDKSPHGVSKLEGVVVVGKLVP